MFSIFDSKLDGYTQRWLGYSTRKVHWSY